MAGVCNMSKNKIWLCLAVLLVLTAAAALKYSTDSFSELNIQTVGELSDEEHPKIALTFDDGPHPVYTPKLLDGLKERGIHATFFLIGKNIEGNEALVNRIQEEGHLIGSHTYNHVQLNKLSESKARDEVLKGCNKIYETTGTYSSFVRPPYGSWKKNLDFCITMIPVSWNVDSLDWKTQNTEKIVKRVVKDVGEGDIILMHDIFDTSVEAALQIVDTLTEEGYQFVTVDELLLEYEKIMDLFDYMKEQTLENESPLASRMRPTTLEEVVGQEHIIGKGKLLYRAIKADKLGSVLFYGPPGTGKTTLAKVIANTTSAQFQQMNATVAGKKDMEEVVKKAQDYLGMYGKKTILFIDEIHRFNKGQQDYLLPFVEDGTLILIGATTENPYFEVNSALISRSIVFELKPLEREDISRLLVRAATDVEKGMGSYDVELEEDAREFLADIAGGDARAALNALELAVLTTEKAADGKIHVTLDVASECIQKRVVRYDKTGDNHYDTVSAFIKSMRGSDPDAAVYYLAKMLYAGEDIKFIARRIMICASEDVGNADPQALVVAVAASQAVERLGMPEAQITLSQAVTYVASAPKSNAACMAVFNASESVKSVRTTVPPHLQDSHYKGAAKLGHGVGYKYAHDYPNHYVEQQYLPTEILGSRFYEPTENGYEKNIREHLDRIRKGR